MSDYKKKYLKYKNKYLYLKNKLEGGVKIERNREIENEIDIYISTEYYYDEERNRKMLILLRNKIREIKSESFSIQDVNIINEKEKNIIYKILEMFNLIEKKFNGIVVTINKLDKISEELNVELDKKLEPKEIKESIYKDLLVDISYNNENLKAIKYNSIILTQSNIERKKKCIKQVVNELSEICKTKKVKSCFAEEVAINDCIGNCVIPYKKSKFIINHSYGIDECDAEENDKR